VQPVFAQDAVQGTPVHKEACLLELLGVQVNSLPGLVAQILHSSTRVFFRFTIDGKRVDDAILAPPKSGLRFPLESEKELWLPVQQGRFVELKGLMIDATPFGSGVNQCTARGTVRAEVFAESGDQLATIDLTSAFSHPNSNFPVDVKSVQIVVKLMPSSSGSAPNGILRKSGWQPIGLSYDESVGLLAVGYDGGVSEIIPDLKDRWLHTLFRSPPSYGTPWDITAGRQSALICANPLSGDARVIEYSFQDKRITATVLPHEACTSAVTDGKTLYVTVKLGSTGKIEYWRVGEKTPHGSWDLPDFKSLGPLILDPIDKRLIAADPSAGKLYSISIPAGKVALLAEDAGFTTALASDQDHIIVGSGHKVLFLKRRDNTWDSPPASLGSVKFRDVSGLAVDSGGDLWIAERYGNCIRGPMSLK